MDLPINDEELATVITALKLGGDTALHNKLKLVKLEQKLNARL